MIDPISFGASAVCGAAAAYTVHQNLKHLSTVIDELRSIADECSRLEANLPCISIIEQEPQHQGLASSSRFNRPTLDPSVDGALVDAHTRLSELQRFIHYVSEKAQEDNRGDHWQWIRKKNNIDRLRAELRSIKYDFAVRCSNASPDLFNKELFMVQHTDREPIQSAPRQGVTSRLHSAKTDERCASHKLWNQLYQEYPRAEWTSAYCQRQPVQTFQPPNDSEPEIRPTVQEPSSFWLRIFPCACVGQCLPSSSAITLFFGRTCSSIRTCYMLIALGLLSIAGSLALALWRTINNGDIQGGFSLAQYILAVGAFIIGCVLVLHSRTCSCWSSPLSTGGNRTPPGSRPIELRQTGGSDSSARHTAEFSV